MAESPEQPASYADLQAVPPDLVAELIDGRLVTHPRPSPRHVTTAFALALELGGPFQKGTGGPLQCAASRQRFHLVNVAVHVSGAFIVTGPESAVGQPALHPVKVDPSAAAALSVTTLPTS